MPSSAFNRAASGTSRTTTGPAVPATPASTPAPHVHTPAPAAPAARTATRTTTTTSTSNAWWIIGAVGVLGLVFLAIAAAAFLFARTGTGNGQAPEPSQAAPVAGAPQGQSPAQPAAGAQVQNPTPPAQVQGQTPQAQTSPVVLVPYTVKQNDNLTIIARHTGVSVANIIRQNGILDPNTIYFNQVLQIPTFPIERLEQFGAGSEVMDNWEKPGQTITITNLLSENVLVYLSMDPGKVTVKYAGGQTLSHQANQGNGAVVVVLLTPGSTINIDGVPWNGVTDKPETPQFEGHQQVWSEWYRLPANADQAAALAALLNWKQNEQDKSQWVRISPTDQVVVNP